MSRWKNSPVIQFVLLGHSVSSFLRFLFQSGHVCPQRDPFTLQFDPSSVAWACLCRPQTYSQWPFWSLQTFSQLKKLNTCNFGDVLSSRNEKNKHKTTSPLCFASSLLLLAKETFSGHVTYLPQQCLNLSESDEKLLEPNVALLILIDQELWVQSG